MVLNGIHRKRWNTIYYKSKTARTIRKRANINLFGVVIVNCYGAWLNGSRENAHCADISDFVRLLQSWHLCNITYFGWSLQFSVWETARSKTFSSCAWRSCQRGFSAPLGECITQLHFWRTFFFKHFTNKNTSPVTSYLTIYVLTSPSNWVPITFLSSADERMCQI